jgi:hypothetical protein
MISENIIRKYGERRDFGLIWGAIPTFVNKYWEKLQHTNQSSYFLGIAADLECGPLGYETV